MEWLFGRRMTPEEMLRKNQRALNKVLMVYFQFIIIQFLIKKKKKKNAQRSGRSMAIIRNRTIKLEVLCCWRFGQFELLVCSNIFDVENLYLLSTEDQSWWKGTG